MPVQFFNITKMPILAKRKKLKSFIEFLFNSEKKELLYLSYIFCSDSQLLKINQDFLAHDFYTDIITFDMSSKSAKVEGEIYISVDRVKDNSLLYVTEYNTELHRVIFHGALHLCGYKDKTAQQKILMRELEDKYLNLYFNKCST